MITNDVIADQLQKLIDKHGKSFNLAVGNARLEYIQCQDIVNFYVNDVITNRYFLKGNAFFVDFSKNNAELIMNVSKRLMPEE